MLLFIVPVLASPQQVALGLTSEEILQMEPQGWIKYYRSKVSPDALHAEREAIHFYILCLRNKNDALFARLQHYDQERLNNYREVLGKFRQNFLDVLCCYAGQAEPVIKQEAMLWLKEELLFQKLVSLNSKIISDPTQARYSEIVEMIGSIRKELAQHAIVSVEERTEFEQENIDWRRLQQSAVKTLSAYDALLSLLPRERQEETLAVLHYCWEILISIKDLRNGGHEFLLVR